MKIVPIPLRSEGNPAFPLPREYFREDEGSDVARQMRVNAVRQWRLYHAPPGTPKEKRRELALKRAEAFCGSLSFFDKWYLMPEYTEAGDIVFDPGFYDLDPCPTPEYHWHLSRARVLHRIVAAVAPRGSAKTKYFQKTTAMQMLSQPKYSFLYMTAMQDIAEDFGDDVKFNLYNNERVFNDFAPEPEFGGRIAPRKGEAKTGVTMFALTNRSRLMCSSAESRKRGRRPIEIVVDDAEWDSKQSTPMETLRLWFEHVLVHILLPMVQRPGTRLTWVGTFVSQQHYLWHIMQNQRIVLADGNELDIALDPKFRRWYRIVQPAAFDKEVIEPSGEKKIVRVSCWPDMWPVDDDEKERRNLSPETRTLDDIRLEIGEEAFEAEYMCRPGSGVAAYFPQLQEDLHNYWYEDYDDAFYTAPYASRTKICWMRNKEKIVMELREFCTFFKRFACWDTSDTAGSHSDYKVAVTMAITDKNELFVLDLWAAQCEEDELLIAGFQQADRWRVSVAGPEYVRAGIGLFKRMEDVIRTRAMEAFNVEHLPNIMPIKVGTIPKCAKISALFWRFQHGLIKLPFAYRHMTSTPWPMLFNQIVGFQNRGGDETGLYKDDCLDGVAMHRFVVPSLPAAPTHETGGVSTDPVEMMKQGKFTDPKTGTSYAMMALNTLTPADVQAILAKRAEQKAEQDALEGSPESVA